MVTFDIKGAFDAVTPNRMVARLISQDWPTQYVRWVSSFLRGRSAKMRVDGVLSKDEALPGTLPQGSPVSPILFALFMSPLYSSASSVLVRGYADDGCLVATGYSLKETTDRLVSDI